MTSKHTSMFTSPVTVGAVVTGISKGTTAKGRRYSTEWSGIYDGIKPSEWTGKPDHWFHDGIIGQTPQTCFAMPVSHFPVTADEPAPSLTTWCKTCGNPVEGEGRQCACWCLLSEALQRFLGMDFDGSAQMAADLWEQEADKEYVWSNEYADDHDVDVYPDMRAVEGGCCAHPLSEHDENGCAHKLPREDWCESDTDPDVYCPCTRTRS